MKKRMLARKGATAIAALALAFALTACGGTTALPDGVTPPSESAVGEIAVPEDQVPTGFPEGFNCDTVAELASSVTKGLYLNFRHEPGGDSGTADTYLSCGWYAVPLSSGQSLPDISSKIRLQITASFQSDMDADYRDKWCERIRGANQTADATLDGHGQCGASLPVADTNVEASVTGLCHTRIGAWVPYFTICLGPTEAHPVADDVGFSAIRHIADQLSANLEFKEKVIVSTADNDADLVRDWVAAGMPLPDEVPEWYCSASPDTTTIAMVSDMQKMASFDNEMTVSDNVNTAPAIPEVTVADSYRVQVTGHRCIFGVRRP